MAFFFPECLIHVLFLEIVTIKVKMVELCTEYPSLTIITWSEWEDGTKGWILQSLTVYACSVAKWNSEMTRQSKLDPCLLYCGPWAKKRPTSLLNERVQHLKEKSWAKNFHHIKQGTSESLFMRKKFWGLGQNSHFVSKLSTTNQHSSLLILYFPTIASNFALINIDYNIIIMIIIIIM